MRLEALSTVSAMAAVFAAMATAAAPAAARAAAPAAAPTAITRPIEASFERVVFSASSSPLRSFVSSVDRSSTLEPSDSAISARLLPQTRDGTRPGYRRRAAAPGRPAVSASPTQRCGPARVNALARRLCACPARRPDHRRCGPAIPLRAASAAPPRTRAGWSAGGSTNRAAARRRTVAASLPSCRGLPGAGLARRLGLPPPRRRGGGPEESFDHAALPVETDAADLLARRVRQHDLPHVEQEL